MERGYADPVDDFKNGARVRGNKVSTGEGFRPVDLAGKGHTVAILVDSSQMGKKVERPPLLRGHESSFNRDLGVLALALPHLKPTATEWPVGEGEGHLRRNKRRDGRHSWCCAVRGSEERRLAYLFSSPG